MKRMLLLLLGTVLFAGLAFAHGDEHKFRELLSRSARSSNNP
jgi:hypothetical protein